MSRNCVALFLACLVISCTAPSPRATQVIISPAGLNAHADDFNNRHVVVRGWLYLKPEANCLLESPPGSPTNGRLSEVVSVAFPKLIEDEAYSLNGQMVEVEGIFRKDIIGTNRILLGACNLTGIEVKRIHSGGE